MTGAVFVYSSAISIEAMLCSTGMRWKEMPSGGLKPVAPPWLSSSVRSMYQ